MTTFADIKTLVRYELSDSPLAATAQITVSADDDATLKFRLPHENVQVTAVYVDTVLKTPVTHYSVDEHAGIVSFVTAPGSGAVILVYYTHSRWHDDDIEQAVKDSVYHLFPAFYVRELHTDDGGTPATTFTTTAGTYEYAIRTETEFVAGLDWRYSDSYNWTRLRRARYSLQRDGTLAYIRFRDDMGSGFFRVHSIERPTPFVNSDDTMDEVGLNERAVRPLVLYACYRLINMTLASRVRSDVAITTQGEGGVPPYEIARAANAYLMAHEAELDRCKMAPWSTR